MTGSMMDPEWKLQARVEIFRARAIERGNRIERLQRLIGKARRKNCVYHNEIRELHRNYRRIIAELHQEIDELGVQIPGWQGREIPF